MSPMYYYNIDITLILAKDLKNLQWRYRCSLYWLWWRQREYRRENI